MNNSNNAAAAAVNERMERASRWIRVNQCLNCTITLVALVFSLLLFTILVCWVVLTSAYVVSIDKQCDVPLKTYYWFATLQLILDVFRGDIMRHIFHYDAHAHNSANSRQRNSGLPRRVIAYNIAYIVFTAYKTCEPHYDAAQEMDVRTSSSLLFTVPLSINASHHLRNITKSQKTEQSNSISTLAQEEKMLPMSSTF